MLRALGYDNLAVFHMNEGHSALLTTALLEEEVGARGEEGVTPEAVEQVRQRCVFTTHTPVPAGHDQFDRGLVQQLLDARTVQLTEQAEGFTDGVLNMTHLALRLSRYANAVALRHGQVSREMFPGYPIAAITNGVHAVTWVADPMKDLFDRHIPGWRLDPVAFRHAIGIPATELRRAHETAKWSAIESIRQRTGAALDPNVLTIGFARRAARYKRAELVFSDVARLRQIAQHVGPIQFLIAGKAHPADEMAKATIRHVHEAAAQLKGAVQVVYVEDYNMSLARDLVAGVDLWLNNPQRPLEASGTSGMKAAMNGVPSLSTLDGWWIEGHVEGVTGWSIGTSWDPAPDEKDAEQLYSKLEMVVAPMYYRQPERWAEVMRYAIALNGSFFNAQRMVMQYAQEAYRL
ncbi:MAG: alpha-glucan family phosphorylase [Dehalococcoidia bacterium]|nr:alpha-glucan family phosphorylase [Dehalococcoidia bacterium]